MALTIPLSRVPKPASGSVSRNVFLAFSGDSLLLPAGLEYVDDVDVATAYNE